MELFCNLVITFFLFGFCGWVCESIFCSVLERKPVNRGFVSGPLCPVYGFGGLIVVFFLHPLRENVLLLFLAGMLACTVLEYVTSYILEKLFQTSWWDYSHLHFHLNGRVCLQFSLLFGALSVVAERLLAALFRTLVDWIPAGAKPWLALALLAVFFADCSVTVRSILQLNGKLEELKRLSAELRGRLEQYHGGSMSLSQHLEKVRQDRSEKAKTFRESISGATERLEALRTKRSFQQHRLLRAFPHMKSIRYGEQLSQIKASWAAWKEKVEKSKKTS